VSERETPLPLEGLKVVDAATLFAGPVIGCLMGDYGADVIKVEHPSGDNLRTLGWQKDGVSLWWALVARNKRCVTLKLSDPRGQELMRELLRDADVLIENFRPGTLERWNLGPDVLYELNPKLVMVRTTGFGQTGPYSHLPGFGTLAESISGYAHINGWPDGPPTLPPFALADSIAALTGTFAAMVALWWREHGGAGRGQVIDLSIYEPMFWVLGPQALLYDQLGIVQSRTGSSALHFSAQRLPRQGRALAGPLRECPVDRGAGDEDRRARGTSSPNPGSGTTRGGWSTPTNSTPSSRTGSADTRPRWCSKRSPSTRPPSLRSTRSRTSSATRSTRPGRPLRRSHTRSSGRSRCKTSSRGSC